MLTRPLHHAYLSAGRPDACLPVIRESLQDLFADTEISLEINTAFEPTLKIEPARDLVDYSQRASAGSRRCFLRGFESMTGEAQNTLLKALEEPAEGVHFFLVTPNPDQLLETVRSRTQRLDICSPEPPAATQEMAEEFLAADTLPERLAAVADIDDRRQLREFIHTLQEQTEADQSELRSALALVAQWVNDSGAAVDQLAEYLAIVSTQADR